MYLNLSKVRIAPVMSRFTSFMYRICTLHDVKCFQHRHSPNLRVRNATYSDGTAFYLTLEEKLVKMILFSKDLKDSGKVKVFKGKIKIYVLS